MNYQANGTLKQHEDALLFALSNLNVSEAARSEFLRMLRTMPGSKITVKRSILLLTYRVEMARKMLDNGMTVAQTRQALMERATVSRRSAYRLIVRALNIRRGHHG